MRDKHSRRELLRRGLVSAAFIGSPSFSRSVTANGIAVEKTIPHAPTFRSMKVKVATSRDLKTAPLDPLTGQNGFSVLAHIQLPLAPMPDIVDIYLIALNCNIIGGTYQVSFENRKLHSDAPLQLPALHQWSLYAVHCKLNIAADDPAVIDTTLDELTFDETQAKGWTITIHPQLIK